MPSIIWRNEPKTFLIIKKKLNNQNKTITNNKTYNWFVWTVEKTSSKRTLEPAEFKGCETKGGICGKGALGTKLIKEPVSTSPEMATLTESFGKSIKLIIH